MLEKHLFLALMKQTDIIFAIHNSKLINSTAEISPLLISFVEATLALHRLLPHGSEPNPIEENNATQKDLEFHTALFKQQTIKISHKDHRTVVFVLGEEFDFSEIKKISHEIHKSEDPKSTIETFKTQAESKDINS